MSNEVPGIQIDLTPEYKAIALFMQSEIRAIANPKEISKRIILAYFLYAQHSLIITF